jgi:3-oxoadipate CoA-transferase alpha subunit
MIDKTVRDVAAALEGIGDGATVLLGGFAGVGEPRALLEGLVESGVKDLTLVANTTGRAGSGMGRLVSQRRVRKIIASFSRRGSAPDVQAQIEEGWLTLEIVPQGTLAERLRAAGAGVPAFYTRTGVDTEIADGKEHRDFAGVPHILEHAIYGDVALIEAWEADRWGNLTFRSAGRNFNPVMATAARLTVCQAQHLVPLGDIDPERIATPGLYVHRVLHLPVGDPPA